MVICCLAYLFQPTVTRKYFPGILLHIPGKVYQRFRTKGYQFFRMKGYQWLLV